MQVRRRSLVLSWVFFIAIACRAGVFFAFPEVFDFVGTGTIHGSEAYDLYARNLSTTGVYGLKPGSPDAALPPAYGVVLAGIYGLFGRAPSAVAAVQTAFDLGTIAIVIAMGSAIFRSATIGTLAGLLVACYPYLVFQTLAVNDTALFLLELHAFVWLAVLLRDRPRADRFTLATAVLAGLVLGVGTLTRPVIFLVACGIVPWTLFRRPLRETARRLLPLGLSAVLVVAAWTGRNLSVFGRLVPIATNAGSNFWQGNNPETLAFLRAGYDVQWIPSGPLRGFDHRDPASNRAFFAAGIRFLRDNPNEIPSLVREKLLAHWSIDVTPRRNPAPGAGPPSGRDPGDAVSTYSRPLFDRLGRRVHMLYWGAALGLAVLGFLATWRMWRDVSIVWIVEASLTVFFVTFHPSTRYRLPGDPLLFLLSAAGLLALAAAARRFLSPQAPPRAPDRHVPDVHHDRLEEQLKPGEQR